MRQLAYALPQLPGLPIRPTTYAAWPVWSGSTTADIQWPKVVRQAVIDWYHKARQWNAMKREAGRYGGDLGSACMRVLECLIFDFQNWRTGRLDPSYEGIVSKTGLGRSTVAKALARLRRLGLIHWQRRSDHHWRDGRFELRQKTNAYMLLPPSQWRGAKLPPEAPPPHPSTWGATPPLPDPISQAVEELRHDARKTALAILDADPQDRLAVALASLGRAIEESEKTGET